MAVGSMSEAWSPRPARIPGNENEAPADAAITGLEEAEILLREDRTGKVRTLVRSLKPHVESLGLEREALAAYRRFAAAVEHETATATMARELAKVIERARKRIDGPAQR